MYRTTARPQYTLFLNQSCWDSFSIQPLKAILSLEVNAQIAQPGILMIFTTVLTGNVVMGQSIPTACLGITSLWHPLINKSFNKTAFVLFGIAKQKT